MRRLCLLLVLLAVAWADDLDGPLTEAGRMVDDENFRAAISRYHEILVSFPGLDTNRRSRIYNNLGYCHYRLHDYPSAIGFYRQALELDANYFLCLNNLAAVLVKTKQYRQALPYLERADALNGGYVKVVFNLFVAHARLQERSQARAYLRRALELDRGYTLQRLKRQNFGDGQIVRLEEWLREP